MRKSLELGPLGFRGLGLSFKASIGLGESGCHREVLHISCPAGSYVSVLYSLADV